MCLHFLGHRQLKIVNKILHNHAGVEETEQTYQFLLQFLCLSHSCIPFVLEAPHSLILHKNYPINARPEILSCYELGLHQLIYVAPSLTCHRGNQTEQNRCTKTAQIKVHNNRITGKHLQITRLEEEEKRKIYQNVQHNQNLNKRSIIVELTELLSVLRSVPFIASSSEFPTAA